MTGIYLIRNDVNGKCYVGQSTNIQARWNKHKSTAFNPNNACYDYPLYRAIRKYGIQNFTFQVLIECPREQLNTLEIRYIAQYDACTNGYNQMEGGRDAEHWLKLNPQKVLSVITYLQTSDESSEIIGQRFNVSGRTIRAINTGEEYRISGIEYPIRRRVFRNGRQPRQPSVCAVCGNITHNSVFCSQECCHRAQQRTDRPDAQTLAEMVARTSFVEVGKRFGVSGNAIAKWCIAAGLPGKKQAIIDWYSKNCISISNDNICDS